MRRFVIGVLLSCLSAIAVAADSAEIAKKLIGYEYAPVYPVTSSEDPLPGLGDCMAEGGWSISDGFGASIIRCGKDRLLALKRTVGFGEGRMPRYRILDAIVLPKFDRNGTSRDNNSTQLWPGGMVCEVDGDSETDTQVLLRWGGHDRITSKNGVLAAWGFDLEKGKIISLDISRIVCEKPDAP